MQNSHCEDAMINATPEDIDITTICREMGHNRPSHSDCAKIGIKLQALYLKARGKYPPKCKRYVAGAVRTVNRYTTEDRSLMEEAIHEVLGN
jgi:hypothetical protein